MKLPWTGTAQLHTPSLDAGTTRWQPPNTLYTRYRRDPVFQAKAWQGVAILALVSLACVSLAWLRVAHTPTVEPYYVYVTPGGQVLGTEKVSAKPYNPEEAMLRVLTEQWIEWVRSIPLDPYILEQNWKRAMQMSTQPVAQRLYAYAKAIDLTKLAGKAKQRELAVKIVVENVLTLSERVFRVTWRETVYDGGNAEKDTTQYTGEFEFIVKKPTTQKELDQNELGIWMARFTWNKNAG